MNRLPRTPDDAEKLLQLSDLLRQTALTIKEEWANETFAPTSKTQNHDSARLLPSRKLWDAERTVEAISGALVELVSEPQQRIQQVATSFFEPRALYIAAERRIPDLLVEAGDEGLDIGVLAVKTGIESKKLGAKAFSVCWCC